MKRQSTSAERRLEDWRKRERDLVDAMQRDVELFYQIVGGKLPPRGHDGETLPGSYGSPGAGER
jgi:hypothetical protein